jgi:hypothetical protein
MKETLVQQCLDILKRDDIKQELKKLFTPIIDLILLEMNPYIYIILTLVFFIFIMILAILILLIFLLRNRNILMKIN